MGKHVEDTTFNFGGAAGADVSVGAANDTEGLTFNLTDVEESKQFEVLPKGTYNAIVDEMEFKESSKGNPMIAVIYSLTDPEFENRKIFDYWVLKGDGSEFGLAKLKKFLVRICPEVDLASFRPDKFAEEAVAIGRELRVKLKIQTQKKGEYAGTKRNTVDDIEAPGNAGAFL